MPDSNKNSDDSKVQTTIFSKLCQSTKISPCIHPDEMKLVNAPCAGRSRLNIVTCQDVGIEKDLADVAGLDMANVKLHVPGKALPDDIPIIPRDMFKCPSNKIPSETVGVMLNDILSNKCRKKNGFSHMPKNHGINQGVLNNRAFKGKSVILFSTGTDVLIETLWWERRQIDFFKRIVGMGFDAITGMNFSVFNGECPFAHALNIKKSVLYCGEFDKLGVWTIPHIYAINDHHRERWKCWLLANPVVQMVTINSQLQRRQKQGMNEVFKTVLFLLENTRVEIIIHGSPKGLASLRKRFGSRLHFATSEALKKALIRKDKTPAEYIDVFRHKIRAFALS